MTDHANYRDTDSSLIFKLLIYNVYLKAKKLARTLQYPLHLSSTRKELKNDRR